MNDKNMDQKALVAIVLCVIFYVAYSQYLSRRYPNYGKRPVTTSQTTQPTPTPVAPVTPQAPPTNAPSAAPSATIPALPENELTFATDTAVFKFSQNDSAITSIKLKDYHQAPKGQPGAKEPVELLDSPLIIQGLTNPANHAGAQGFQASRQGNTLRLWREEGPWHIEQAFTVDKGYGLDVNVTFKNQGTTPIDLSAATMVRESMNIGALSGGLFSGGSRYERPSMIALISDSRSSEDVAKYCKKDANEPAVSATTDDISYFGFDHHYFLTVLEPQSNRLSLAMQKAGVPAAAGFCQIVATASQSFGLVQPGQTVTMAYKGFFGPKDPDILNAYNPKLNKAIYMGWFGIIADPLLAILKLFYRFIGNYGWAIIVVTVLLKLAFYPLTKQAAVSMKRTQKLQPEMNKLRERYKDDPARQQQELMKFMSQNKINPAKGCLPNLPQLPVFIALYNVLSHSIALRHAPFLGWIGDLSAADPYFITPILLGVLMLVQQRLTPNAGLDKTQQKIMLMMPIIFTVMMLSLPSGLVLYMVTNSVISIVQQHWLNKRLA